MTSRRFQVIVAGTKIGFAVKPLRSVSRKFTKAWIATVRDLCIDFDISGHANLTSIRASDAIPAPSAFISTLPGKYQVLLRTDCKTLRVAGRHAETALHDHRKRSLWDGLQAGPPLAGIPELQVRSGVSRYRQIPQRFHLDSRRLPARHCCSECHALALFNSIAKAFWKAHEFRPQLGVLYATTPPWKRHRNRASFGVGSIPMGDVVTMLDVRRRFEIPAALCQPRSRKIALAAQRLLLGTDSDFTNSIRTNNATT